MNIAKMKYIYGLIGALIISFSANRAQAQSYTIYPTPQQMTESTGSVELTSQINFICESGIDRFTQARAQEVFEKAGYTLVEATAPSQTLTNLYVGVNGSNDIVAQYASDNNLPLEVFTPANNKFDAHLLQVNGNSPHGDIVVLGDSNGSAFYAFATLEQMFEQSAQSHLNQVTFEDYAHLQHRGIVEGFYGHTYSVENRLSLFEFCKRLKMNTFIYGPKSDPYHLGNWRENYPTTITEQQRYMGMITQDDLRTIGEAARRNHVNFVWAAHPGMQQGISFSESGISTGVDALMTKFQHLYDLGIRGFGVFIDDMTFTPSGAMQALLANSTQERLREQFSSQTPEDKISPLFFIPTAYALNYSTSYTLSSLASVDSEVVIGFTGYDCFSNVRASSIADMASRVGRNPLMWWNNPVNDDHDERIYMRELTAHWTIEDQGPINTLNSLVSNPMNQPQASKVALFGVADYAWNPATFDAHENWEDAFAHIAQPGDTVTAEALKTFARFSNSTIEDEDMVTLYDNFQSKFSNDNLPDETTELRNRLTELKEACLLIENMQYSDIENYRLIYNDLRPWNAKLKTMSTLVIDALDMLELGDNLSRSEGWEKYNRLNNLYSGINTDSIYMVSALEDAGTRTREEFYMVTPGDAHFRPFVDFIVGKTGTNIPGEWPENDQPQIITNIENLTTPTLSITGDHYTLEGLQGITLCKGEYVGIYLGSIQAIQTAEINTPNGLTLESSINGKVWNEVQLPANEDLSTGYIRLKNNNDSDIILDIASLSIGFSVSNIVETPTASTDMKTYTTHYIDNVIDGNTSTFFWAGGKQTTGNYILLTYPSSSPRQNITITFTQSDQLQGEAVIELSNDNNNWETVAEFAATDIDSKLQFSCNANGRQARYVRFRITNDMGTGYWLQVAEFSVETTTGKVSTFTQTTDHKGEQITTLSDKNLTTGYQASEAGYIEHNFIENLNIETIEIYHNTVFDTQYNRPVISVFNGEEWIEKGYLNDYCTLVDTRDEKMVLSVKISWNEHNIPNIYEILPVGTPYLEDRPSRIEGVIVNRPIVYVHDNTLVVKSGEAIQSVTLYDMTGRVVNRYEANGNIVEIALGKGMPSIFAVQIIDQTGNTFTQKERKR